MSNKNEIYVEKDKYKAPYLLAASFQGRIQFCRFYIEGRTVYWEFSPREQALKLIDSFLLKQDPYIPAKDLFEAISYFWEVVSSAKR